MTPKLDAAPIIDIVVQTNLLEESKVKATYFVRWSRKKESNNKMEVSPISDEKEVKYKLCLKPIIGSLFLLTVFYRRHAKIQNHFTLYDKDNI